MTKSQPTKSRTGRPELLFLGVPELRFGARVLTLRRRKTLALLAYLALEPVSHTRDKLAALFWQESDDTLARSSLRTALSEISSEFVTTKNLLRSSRDSISLDVRKLDLDVHKLKQAFRAVNEVHPELEAKLENAQTLYRGDLLEGLDFSDAPAFDDWLIAQREVVRGWLDVVLEHLCDLQMQAGRLQHALQTALKRLHLEPLNEAAHRKVIELHMQMGSRSKALEAYQNCQEVLESELGLIPDQETQALIRQLQKTDLILSPRALAPLENTQLVGRNDVWVQMEAAWQVGQHIFISGEAGAGKSRMMLEFAATKGAFAQQFGRPGDNSVPFSSITRGIRHALSLHPNLELPVWVRTELSRLLPELEQIVLLPLSSKEDRLRLFDAVNQFFLVLRELGLYPLGDDLQFFDDSSMELVTYMIVNSPRLSGISSISAFRGLEVSTRFKELVSQMVETERAILIELEPLGAENISQMLHDLMPNTPQANELALTLQQFTGGNPLFVLETIRALSERGGLENLTVERFENRRRVAGLPRTPKVQTIISRRLERLSNPAKDLARLAAIMGEEFNLERASRILQIKQFELLKTNDELEMLQVMRGGRFGHDLIFETVLEGIAEGTRTVLHSLVLDELEGSSVAAAIMAHHAFVSSRHAVAFEYSVKAAEDAFFMGDFQGSLEHTERARHLLNESIFEFQPVVKDPKIVLDLYNCVVSIGYSLNQQTVSENAIQELLTFARKHQNLHLESRGLTMQSETFSVKTRIGLPDPVQQQRLLEQALEVAARGKQREDWIYIQSCLIYLEQQLHQGHRAIERAEKVLPVAREFASNCLIDIYHYVALAHEKLGNWYESIEYHDLILADPRFTRPSDRANNRMWRAVAILGLGRIQEACSELRQANQIMLEYSPHDSYTSSFQYFLGFGLCDVVELFEAFELATVTNKKFNLAQHSVFFRLIPIQSLGTILYELGQLKQATIVIYEWLGLVAEFLGSSPWALKQLDTAGSLACSLYAVQNDWVKACKYAVKATQGRFEINQELDMRSIRLHRYLEVEALLRGGEIDLARETVRRLEEFAGHYARRQIQHLRSLSVLEAWEGNLENAIRHLLQARDLMIPIGLPNERWTLESQLATLYQQNNDLEKAQEARATALGVIDSLAEKITDLEMQKTFLEFAKQPLNFKQHQK